MKQRISSTLFLCGIISFTLIKFGLTGGILLLIFVAALTQYELYKLMELLHYRPYKYTSIAVSILALCKNYFRSEGICELNCTISALSVATVLFALSTVLSHNPKSLLTAFLPTIFGTTFIVTAFALPISFIKTTALYTGSPQVAIALILWIVVVTKFSDIGGLLVGSKWGKHPLAPQFSPKKTYEGLAGSIVFSLLSGLVLSQIYIHYFQCWPNCFGILKIYIISSMLSFFALISDLIESGFKRLANQKDSGRTIPGIGGIFDLTDSLILTLPLGVILIQNFVFC